MIVDAAFARRATLVLNGYRLCHNKSARKHRRQGHHVQYAGEGWYAWKAPESRTGEGQ